MNTSTTRIPALDALRVLAVGLVIAAHLFQRYGHPFGKPFGSPDLYWVTIGGLGVTLFLILSGFVIEWRYGSTDVTYATFLWRRISHLYPTYFVALALTFLVFGREVPAASLPIRILDALGIASLAGIKWRVLMLPMSWFLGLILAMYALWPLLNRALASQPHVTLLAALMVSVAARLFVSHYFAYERPMDWFVPCRVFEFVLGMWLAHRTGLLRSLAASSSWPKVAVRTLSYLSVISFPVYLIHGSIRDWSLIDPLPTRIFVPVFLALSIFAGAVITRITRPIEHRLRATASSVAVVGKE